MAIDESGFFISGVTEQGKKFRPSDWVERLASTFADFKMNRLFYCEAIKPVVQGEQKGLFVANNFAERNPQGFQFVMEFARSNCLQIESVGEHVFQDVA